MKMSPCRSSKSSSGNNFSEDALTEMAETRRLSSEGESCSEAPSPALVRNPSPASALRERVALFSAQRQASDSFLLRNQHHHQPDCLRWAAFHEALHCDNAAQDNHKVSFPGPGHLEARDRTCLRARSCQRPSSSTRYITVQDDSS